MGISNGFILMSMQSKLLVSFLSFSLSINAAPIYFLVDQDQTPQYVIKPAEPNCLKLREHIPCQRTAQAEALAFALANTLGLAHLTPETYLAVIPFGSSEKLCSVQQYIPNMENLRELAQEWLDADISDEELIQFIDPISFQEQFLFILLLYDTDAHANNIYAIRDDNGVYFLIKIDNGLSFPNKNRQLFNSLYLLPQSRSPFSERIVELIQTLPMEKLKEQFDHFEMQNSYPAFEERVAILQALTKENHYTMREIDLIFRKLEKGVIASEEVQQLLDP
jgi:hypothetical protein